MSPKPQTITVELMKRSLGNYRAEGRRIQPKAQIRSRIRTPFMPQLLAIPTNQLPYPVRFLNEYCLASYILFEASDRSGGFGIWFSYVNDLLDLERNNAAGIQRQPQSQSQSQTQSQCNGEYLLHFLEHESGHSSKHKRYMDADGDVKMPDIADRHDNSNNNDSLERVLDEILREI
ncbi:hypothetical protein BDDG_01716 [Blastomyces dermatitidis ATCC 18188]|uniref:Uncharacterized protein n=1 Tax=Ajellomyces dermatitidis (strain ATCC 18188 / CBS 674.68) TaxID=653446 RepID=F2T6G5_AJEDA|nr:hypothetical protein BDDG_01716 [Blastomyces dermatitidis ATCC 18188]